MSNNNILKFDYEDIKSRYKKYLPDNNEAKNNPQSHIRNPRYNYKDKYMTEGQFMSRSEAARKYGVGSPMDKYYNYLQSEKAEPNSKGMNMAEMIGDPDDDSSSLCTACTIPIFSTPSISFSHGDDKLFMHQQCADLPRHLLHELHPLHTLLLIDTLTTPTTAPTCTNCNRICGTIFYQCPYSDDGCDFRLDLVCVLQIKILHRSHRHPMMVIRQREAASLTCSSCDSKHEASSSSESATLSYLCNLCSYWIHPDCATLPNAIVRYVDHAHPLFLTYNLPTHAHNYSFCMICASAPKRDSGVYICLICSNNVSDFLVHMRCALTRPTLFKPVFIREAKAAELCRLPLADESTSLIPYISEGSDEKHRHLERLHPRPVIFHKNDDDQSSPLRLLPHPSIFHTNDDDQSSLERLHPHPLIFHKNDDDQSSRVCSVCTQFLSPPFFSCLQCPNFFVHSCCAHLPREIPHRAHMCGFSLSFSQHRVHMNGFSLSPRAPKSDFSGVFYCEGCDLRSNGFAYNCVSCKFSLDITCAFINPAITHESHKKTHILFMCRHIQFPSDEICNCCRYRLSGIWYECSICRDFKLHVRCALLPKTVRHVFDEHPLQLITTDNGRDDEICEVCEHHIKTKCWYYGCGECDQSFHIGCIPSVDRLSRIKLGSTVFVEGHGCAVTLTREDDVVCRGHRCGFCGEIFISSYNGLAYECSNCFFAIHHRCAEKRLLRTIEITGTT